MFDPFFREACLLVMIFSGIPLLVGTAAGLFVAIIQAATQIQEQSIMYVVKLSAVGTTLVLLWNWTSSELVHFLQQALDSFISSGRI